MNAMPFDTLQFAKKFKAVKSQEEQAEVVAEALRASFDERDKVLAAVEAKVQELASGAKSNAEKMATKEDMIRLEGKIELVSKDLLIKLGGGLIAAVTVILAAIGLAVRYLAH